MKNANSMKEIIILNKLKKEDPVELPMDEMFFEKLHDKIMQSVEKTEIKPLNKWSKTWVFLERKAKSHRAKIKKAVKLSLVATTLALGALLFNLSANYVNQAALAKIEINKTSILSVAQTSPVEWAELIVNYQNENDFYADILSQGDFSTMVEIDRVIAQSL